MINPEKYWLIGIDGGTFDVISPMVKRGELPVISSLMQNGTWGELESTVPPDTGPAWVSMMTGVNPGKHGVFFFLDSLHDNLKFGNTLGSADIKFPPLWSVLSKNNKKVVFINVPFTYPPTEVNGIMISGMLIPDSAQVLSYPPNVFTDLDKVLDGFSINDWSPDVICSDLTKLHLHYDKVIKVISSITEKRKKAALLLLEKQPWDFAMVVFTSIDRLQHLFWKFMKSADDAHSGSLAEKMRDVIQDGYRQLDKAIGEIIEKTGKDTTVMIASDHGFGPLKKYFFVNKWLEEIGLLHVNRFLMRKKICFKITNLRRIIARLSPSTKTPDWAQKIRVPIIRLIKRDTDELINWEKSKAYGDPSGGININLAGREPHGIVKPGHEFEELLKFIQTQFCLLSDESGSKDAKISDWILRKEEIYSGPFVEEAADLYYSLNERSYLHNTNVDGNSKIEDCSVGSGMHRKNGIFIMNGPLGKKCSTIKPRIIDIAPTVLYHMGLPLIDEMDGTVLEEGINPDYLKAHPVTYVSVGKYGKESSLYSVEDEEKIQESLKGLGYL